MKGECQWEGRNKRDKEQVGCNILLREKTPQVLGYGWLGRSRKRPEGRRQERPQAIRAGAAAAAGAGAGREGTPARETAACRLMGFA